MGEIGIGIVGGGYMGKAHAVAMSAVGAVFDTGLRPRLEMVSAGQPRIGRTLPRRLRLQRAPRATGGAGCRPAGRGRHHRLAAIHPPRHCRRGLRARQAGTLRKAAWAQAWTTAAPWSKRRKRAARPTWSASTISAPRPASSPAIDRRGRNRRHHLVPRRTHRGFLCRPASPASWRTDGRANGTMGDLAPHMINAALALSARSAR
jgi:hypothetical protein